MRVDICFNSYHTATPSLYAWRPSLICIRCGANDAYVYVIFYPKYADGRHCAFSTDRFWSCANALTPLFWFLISISYLFAIIFTFQDPYHIKSFFRFGGQHHGNDPSLSHGRLFNCRVLRGGRHHFFQNRFPLVPKAHLPALKHHVDLNFIFLA